MPEPIRQLAAIMFTDIVGYTAMMGKDSNKALELVRQSKQIQKPLVEKHNGKWLKEMGDGAMAQFSSALDAVNCAIEIQKSARVEIDAKLRIGIHLGDITIEDNDIYGDGVNVAARLESIADPGGIYISESIEKAIRGQSDVQAKYIGEVDLKNVDYGVRTYALQEEGLPVPEVKKLSGGFIAQLKRRALSRTGIIYILISIIVIVILGQFVYNKYQDNSDINSVNIDKSIAVMPFDNRSDLEEDASFTDGVHDDLLTQISKIRDIKSISRSSVMEYRNTSKNPLDISEELGVATILVGSVQRAGSEIRINVQLIYAGSDSTMWSETFTRELNIENILAIQSEIAKAVAASLAIVLSPEEEKDLDKLPTKNLAALELYFDAKSSYDKQVKKGFQEAIDNLTIAVELDPTFAVAYAMLGEITLNKFWWAGLDIEEQIAKGKPLIEKAMQLDSTNSDVQMTYGWLKGYEKGAKERMLRKMKAEGINHDIVEVQAAIDKLHYAGKYAYQKAIELNPSNAKAYSLYSSLLKAENKDDEAMAFLFKAKELDPLDDGLGLAIVLNFLRRRRYDEAQQIAEEIIKRKPDYSRAYALLGGVAFAGRHQLAESLQLQYKAATLNPGYPYRMTGMAVAYDHLGFGQQANEWFSSALLLIQGPSPVAGLAKGYINEFKGEYDNAFETYLLAPESDGTVMEITMSNLTNLALKINRTEELIEHFHKVYPQLFEADVLIDESNYVKAFSLGRLLKAKGDDELGEHLLYGSLKVVQRDNSTVVGVEFSNYECRIQLALGNNEAALASFIKLVAKGIYTDQIVRDPVYKPLYRFPEFQGNMDIMKARLAEEQAKVDEMLAEGALNILPLQ